MMARTGESYVTARGVKKYLLRNLSMTPESAQYLYNRLEGGVSAGTSDLEVEAWVKLRNILKSIADKKEQQS